VTFISLVTGLAEHVVNQYIGIIDSMKKGLACQMALFAGVKEGYAASGRLIRDRGIANAQLHHKVFV